MHEEHHERFVGDSHLVRLRPDSRPSFMGSRCSKGEDHVVIQRTGSAMLSISLSIGSSARIAAWIPMRTTSTRRMV